MDDEIAQALGKRLPTPLGTVSEAIREMGGDVPPACRYAFFDRRGGVSTGLFTSLNVAMDVGDEPRSVTENRRRIKEAMGADALLSARQVHGGEVFCLQERLDGDLRVDGVDALITGHPGIGLMIQQADCQAVLVWDPVIGAIGAAHCGWRGSVCGVLPAMIGAMRDRLGCRPADLEAVISPSLGSCCAEFVNFRSELPIAFHRFMVADNHFDFQAISAMQLRDAGLKQEKIVRNGECTRCSGSYFSYRRAVAENGGVTGRQCSVIVLGDRAWAR